MEALLQAFQWVVDFFAGVGGGIVDLIKGAGEWFLGKLFVWWLEAKLWAITQAWDFAKGFLEGLDFSNRIESAFTALPAETRNFLLWLRVPEFITNIVTAMVTKFVLRFTGI